MGFLSGILGLDAGKPTMRAAVNNKDQYERLRDVGHTTINDGQTEAIGALDKAVEAYSPYATTGAAADGLYADALGINGTDGNERATSAFQAGPGYDFAVDSALKAALRGASAGGTLSSGNTLTALSKLGGDFANQEYGSWLDRLAGKSNQGLQAASGQASGWNNISGAYQNSIDRRLNLEDAYTSGVTGATNQAAQGGEANKAAGAALAGGILKNGIGLVTRAKTGGLF